eukprot:7002868-Pyramimonas_sp.AAC.1
MFGVTFHSLTVAHGVSMLATPDIIAMLSQVRRILTATFEHDEHEYQVQEHQEPINLNKPWHNLSTDRQNTFHRYTYIALADAAGDQQHPR